MKSVLDPDMSMNTIMQNWPATIRVLLRHQVLCVGCPIAAFHTVADACREHSIDEATLLGDLNRAISMLDEAP